MPSQIIYQKNNEPELHIAVCKEPAIEIFKAMYEKYLIKGFNKLEDFLSVETEGFSIRDMVESKKIYVAIGAFQEITQPFDTLIFDSFLMHSQLIDYHEKLDRLQPIPKEQLEKEFVRYMFQNFQLSGKDSNSSQNIFIPYGELMGNNDFCLEKADLSFEQFYKKDLLAVSNVLFGINNMQGLKELYIKHALNNNS